MNRGVDEGAVILAESPGDALAKLESPSLTKPVHRGFIIGGASLYRQTLKLASNPSAASDTTSTPPIVNRVLLTRITEPNLECDTFIPDLNNGENGVWEQRSHAELEEWVGLEVAQGVQEEKGVKYEFQMWTRE